MEKLPSALVMVVMAVPFSEMVAPASGSFNEPVTLPVTVNEVLWAITKRWESNNRMHPKSLVIIFLQTGGAIADADSRLHVGRCFPQAIVSMVYVLVIINGVVRNGNAALF